MRLPLPALSPGMEIRWLWLAGSSIGAARASPIVKMGTPRAESGMGLNLFAFAGAGCDAHPSSCRSEDRRRRTGDRRISPGRDNATRQQQRPQRRNENDRQFLREIWRLRRRRPRNPLERLPAVEVRWQWSRAVASRYLARYDSSRSRCAFDFGTLPERAQLHIQLVGSACADFFRLSRLALSASTARRIAWHRFSNVRASFSASRRI